MSVPSVLEVTPDADFIGDEVARVVEEWQKSADWKVLNRVAAGPTHTSGNGVRTRLIGAVAGHEAVLWINGLGTDTDAPNSLMQGLFLHDVLVASGITTTEGKPMPIVLVGTPTRGRHLLHTVEERETVAAGDTDPLANHILDAVMQDYGFSCFGVSGASLGAFIGLGVQAQLRRSNADHLGGDFKEYPSVEKVPIVEKSLTFMAEVRHTLAAEVREGGVMPYSGFYGVDRKAKGLRWDLSGARYILNLLRSGSDNLAMGRAMCIGLLDAELRRTLNRPGAQPITFATGTDSTMSEYGLMHNTIRSATAGSPFSRHAVNLVGLRGKGHAWVDNLPLLGRTSQIAYDHLRR